MTIVVLPKASSDTFQLSVPLDQPTYRALNEWRRMQAPGIDISAAAGQLLRQALAANITGQSTAGKLDPQTEEIVRAFNSIGTITGAL